jgi:hypothetical protein
LILELVEVSEKNGLKLPREFGLIMKQALYFDRYQKILAPDFDPLKNDQVRAKLREEFEQQQRGDNERTRNAIDVDAVDM